MKVEINSYEKEIKIFVSNTDAMELLDMLDKFDADEWDGYDIVIDGYENKVLVYPEPIVTYPIFNTKPWYSDNIIYCGDTCLTGTIVIKA